MSAFFKSIALLFICHATFSQEIYSAKSSKINFFAGTVMEDIDAVSTNSTSFLNIKTGEIVILIPNKSFKFKSKLMQEHFNENYMESEKYPNSEFKGKILNIETYDFKKTEFFTVTVEGNLNVHGVVQKRTIETKIRNNNGVLESETKFDIVLTDHKIDRPQVVWQKLAEKVVITSKINFEALKK